MEMVCQNANTIRCNYSAVLQRNHNLLSRNTVQSVNTYSERNKSHPRNSSRLSSVLNSPIRQHAQRHLLIFSSPLEKGKQQSCPMAAVRSAPRAPRSSTGRGPKRAPPPPARSAPAAGGRGTEWAEGRTGSGSLRPLARPHHTAPPPARARAEVRNIHSVAGISAADAHVL